MYTQAEIEAKIKQIDEALAEGVTTITTDGTTTTVDLDAMRRERRELWAKLDNMQLPVAMRVKLG